MDNYIEVGKIINTFGIKGEVKVASNFQYKEKVFIKPVKERQNETFPISLYARKIL